MSERSDRSGGPAVVAIGGGHGLAVTLRAARRYAGRVTAVVSVADDGGSSGALRRPGLPAMGDLRRCLTALADAANPWVATFEHRFPTGPLAGHAFGNIAIAALTDELGSFSAALDAIALRLGIAAEHRVFPATETLVDLHGATVAGAQVAGQVAVHRLARIDRVWLEPDDAKCPPGAVEAIETADQVVLGPGSLFTSILAAIAVPEVGAAVAGAADRAVYVCNLRTAEPETAGYDVADHVAALRRHGVQPSFVLCQPGALPVGRVEAHLVEHQVARPDGLAHDPELLARALDDLLTAGA